MSLGRRWLVAFVAGMILASGCSMASQADPSRFHKARLNAEAAAAAAASIKAPTAAEWQAAQDWLAAEAATWAALDDWVDSKPLPTTPDTPATDGASDEVRTVRR